EASGTRVGIHHQLGDRLYQPFRHYAISHAPSGHSIGLRKAIEDDSLLQHAWQAGDGYGRLVAVVDARIDFVGEHHQIAIKHKLGDRLYILVRDQTAGWILRRVEHQQLGFHREPFAQRVEIEREATLLD